MHYVDLSGIFTPMLCIRAPPLKGVLHYSALNAVMWERNSVQFLPGTAAYTYIMLMKF